MWIISIIVALLPLLIKAIEWLINNKKLNPRQQRAFEKLKFHCKRLVSEADKKGLQAIDHEDI